MKPSDSPTFWSESKLICVECFPVLHDFVAICAILESDRSNEWMFRVGCQSWLRQDYETCCLSPHGCGPSIHRKFDKRRTRANTAEVAFPHASKEVGDQVRNANIRLEARVDCWSRVVKRMILPTLFGELSALASTLHKYHSFLIILRGACP